MERNAIALSKETNGEFFLLPPQHRTLRKNCTKITLLYHIPLKGILFPSLLPRQPLGVVSTLNSKTLFFCWSYSKKKIRRFSLLLFIDIHQCSTQETRPCVSNTYRVFYHTLLLMWHRIWGFLRCLGKKEQCFLKLKVSKSPHNHPQFVCPLIICSYCPNYNLQQIARLWWYLNNMPPIRRSHHLIINHPNNPQ